MTIYGYQCRQCGQEYTSEYRGDFIVVNDFDKMSCACGHHEIKRKYSLAIHRPMATHYNPTTQTEIGSERQFKRELHEQGRAMEERTGIPTQYEVADPEMLRANVQDTNAEGLEETNRRRVNSGQSAIRI